MSPRNLSKGGEIPVVRPRLNPNNCLVIPGNGAVFRRDHEPVISAVNNLGLAVNHPLVLQVSGGLLVVLRDCELRRLLHLRRVQVLDLPPSARHRSSLRAADSSGDV